MPELVYMEGTRLERDELSRRNIKKINEDLDFVFNKVKDSVNEIITRGQSIDEMCEESEDLLLETKKFSYRLKPCCVRLFTCYSENIYVSFVRLFDSFGRTMQSIGSFLQLLC